MSEKTIVVNGESAQVLKKLVLELEKKYIVVGISQATRAEWENILLSLPDK